MKTLFDLCIPREDVLNGNIKESDFAADLAQELSEKAPKEYRDPAIFFANTHPTQGLRHLLHNICLRQSGKGGEAAAIFRLDTQYGGGKTLWMIALTHVARGINRVAEATAFVDPKLLAWCLRKATPSIPRYGTQEKCPMRTEEKLAKQSEQFLRHRIPEQTYFPSCAANARTSSSSTMRMMW